MNILARADSRISAISGVDPPKNGRTPKIIAKNQVKLPIDSD